MVTFHDLPAAKISVFVLSYGGHWLLAERGFLNKLAFKGGTCLRKLFTGTQGRFSTDLDFTARQEHDPEEMIIEMMEAFDEELHGIVKCFRACTGSPM